MCETLTVLGCQKVVLKFIIRTLSLPHAIVSLLVLYLLIILLNKSIINKLKYTLSKRHMQCHIFRESFQSRSNTHHTVKDIKKRLSKEKEK